MDARAGGQIDSFMADARFLGKVAATGVGVADERRIRIEHGRQAFTQLRFADRPFSGDAIQSLPGTVPGHQHADLRVGNPSLGGRATPLAGRAATRARPFAGFEEVGFVGLGDPMQMFWAVQNPWKVWQQGGSRADRAKATRRHAPNKK